MLRPYDAIVIGAGPAGATAATLLARAGWAVALVEKQEFPRRKVCGECLAATNLPLLDALGVGETFARQAGPPLRNVAFMHKHQDLTALLPTFEQARHAYARALGRESLDSLLLEAAREAGAHILQPWRVDSISGVAGHLRCELRSRRSDCRDVLQAPLVIDAHGSWERDLNPHATSRSPRAADELLAFKANFMETSLSPGLLPVLSFAGGYGGMVVADRGQTTLACCVRADRLREARRDAPGLSAGAVVEAMLRRECEGVAQALTNARRQGPWLAAGPLRPGIHFRSDDTVFRIGNAAAEAHPIIGEGMSMAMQSAWILCNQLVRARHERRDLQCAATQRQLRAVYISAWRRAFASRLRVAAVFAYVAAHPASCALPRSLLRAFPGLLGHAASWSGKVRSVLDPGLVNALAAGPTPRTPYDITQAC